MPSSTRVEKTKEEVEAFLQNVHTILTENIENLIIIERSTKEDKTYSFRAEYGITSKYICEKLLELNLSNYSFTDEDRDTSKPGEIWVFGQMFQIKEKNYLKIYIKLKLREKVICLSFHPKEFDLRYPYN